MDENNDPVVFCELVPIQTVHQRMKALKLRRHAKLDFSFEMDDVFGAPLRRNREAFANYSAWLASNPVGFTEQKKIEGPLLRPDTHFVLLTIRRGKSKA